jgi:hypothetical protein
MKLFFIPSFEEGLAAPINIVTLPQELGAAGGGSVFHGAKNLPAAPMFCR